MFTDGCSSTVLMSSARSKFHEAMKMQFERDLLVLTKGEGV
jgi:hypothetical protein